MNGFDERLAEIGAALGIALTSIAIERLSGFHKLLERWNATYNLTAVREPGAMLSRHFADCLAIVPPLRRHAGGRPLRIVDVGCGAGLPAVVIAVVEPKWAVVGIDAIGKKIAFVRQAGVELRLTNLEAVHARAEHWRGETFDVAVSRAFADLGRFVACTRSAVSSDGCWVAMKGAVPEVEIAEAAETVDVFHVEQLDVPGLAAERCLVWMRSRPADGAAK